jgi:predicted glycosyltransferase
MKVIAGPFLPEPEWREVRATASGRAGLDVVRTVPDLELELAGARASVSQCGYNTALEVVRSGVPALVVPFADPGEDEQTRRAQRLADLGAVRLLDPRRLAAAALADAIQALDDVRPPRLALDMRGGEASADLLAAAVRERVAA